MDLNRLRVLVAVAREGSVTAAAEALHYAQPSVSHHLARLEAEAGVPLVQRAGRGIRLTEAGELLAGRAEEILGRVDSARAEVAAHAGLRAGRVRLAAFPSSLATLVPPAAAALTAAHPGLELALTEAEPPEALTLLRGGEVDVALVFAYDDADEPAGVTATTVLTEPVYLVTPPGRRGNGRRGDLAAYAGADWIAGCPRCRAHQVAACERAGFTPSIRFDTDDYVAAQALVAAGIGVTTLPGLALRAHRNPDVRIARVPRHGRRVLAATYGRPPLPGPVRAFLDALTATAARPDLAPLTPPATEPTPHAGVSTPHTGVSAPHIAESARHIDESAPHAERQRHRPRPSRDRANQIARATGRLTNATGRLARATGRLARATGRLARATGRARRGRGRGGRAGGGARRAGGVTRTSPAGCASGPAGARSRRSSGSARSGPARRTRRRPARPGSAPGPARLPCG